MKSKKVIISVFIFIVAILIALVYITREWKESYHTFHTFEAKNGFEIFFDPNAEKELKQYYKSWTVVINGSYFWMTDSWAYYPAGIWNIKWNDYFKDQIDREDPNLSHIALYDHAGWTVLFLSNEGELPECAKRNEKSGSLQELECSTFQAWPLVLSWWSIPDFSKSWHANESHERTLMGTTEEGKIYFFVFTEKVTLKEAWESIQHSFQNEWITLLNLDGGPSTAYFDGRNGFWESKKLPIILVINTD